MQAQAARAEPEVAMNPVLLKPGSDRTSQVVLMGKVLGQASATSYQDLKPTLLSAVLDAYADLRARYDVVVCEGAGSPTEINLRGGDLVNMGLARPLDLPVVVVGDIDRGGVFAAFHGTVALLDAADQALVSGFIVNKFRGDPSLLTPGLDQIEGFTGRPVLGVVPLAAGDPAGRRGRAADRGVCGRLAPRTGTGARLRVAVVRFPRVSNFTDVDALAIEPGVDVEFTASAGAVKAADLVVLPGTKSTVADLRWLRERGLEAVLARTRGRGPPHPRHLRRLPDARRGHRGPGRRRGRARPLRRPRPAPGEHPVRTGEDPAPGRPGSD